MKRFTSLILIATLFCMLLSGCGKKCYICGENGANYELVGYDLCHDCYMQVLENTEDEPSYSNNNNLTSGDTDATMGERNALKSARQYLNSMAFSYSGLIEQLEYEGYQIGRAHV